MSGRQLIYILLLICLSTTNGAWARGNSLIITDGKGEQVKVKNGWFGNREIEVQDRLGNGFEHKKSIFGNKQTSINVLGNQYQQKKGWFGRSNISGHDVLGDTVTTSKGILGIRTTRVNVGGAAGFLQGLFARPAPPPEASSIPPLLDKQGSTSKAVPEAPAAGFIPGQSPESQ